MCVIPAQFMTEEPEIDLYLTSVSHDGSGLCKEARANQVERVYSQPHNKTETVSGEGGPRDRCVSGVGHVSKLTTRSQSTI